ncbi:unnamed protein product [Heterobilharzia americana]|nr:unnamed protein product [Heterobilharzia americana]
MELFYNKHVIHTIYSMNMWIASLPNYEVQLDESQTLGDKNTLNKLTPTGDGVTFILSQIKDSVIPKKVLKTTKEEFSLNGDENYSQNICIASR